MKGFKPTVYVRSMVKTATNQNHCTKNGDTAAWKWS